MLNTVSETECAGRKPAGAKAQYAQLLTEFVPVAIESEAENERALKVIAGLMDVEKRSTAQKSLLKLLTVLVENFEQRRYPLGESTPLETLKELMRARSMQPKDVLPAFGSKGVVSEVLNGKRGIGKEAAKKLGALFSVPPGVFI
jgi:HTH-type transcriptional regulator / antitoxin HigA